MNCKLSLLLYCGALALGEFLASLAPMACGCWPFLLIVTALIALLGYGLDVRLWPFAALVAFGAFLYFLSASDNVERDRLKPWLRGRVTARAAGSRGDGIAGEVRADFSRRIAVGLDERDETVSLARAILLGERRRMSRRVKRLFVESGTMHIFAISGLHVMAIASVLVHLATLLFVPRRFGGIVSVPFLWGYVAVIGFPPSAVRAATMSTFSLLAPLFWRKPDMLRSWCLTFLAVHLANPQLIGNVGNALSFSVMLAIVAAEELGEGMSRWRRGVLIAVAAWAAGLPISAHVFGRVTPGGMLANLLLLFTAKVSVQAGALGVLASYVSDRLAAHFNNFTALGIRAMVVMADGVSRLPFANFETGAWGYLTCVEWYAALGLSVYLLIRCKRRRMAL